VTTVAIIDAVNCYSGYVPVCAVLCTERNGVMMYGRLSDSVTST